MRASTILVKIAAVVVVVVSAVVLHLAQAKDAPAPTAELLCAGERLNLTTKAQLLNLAREMYEKNIDCPADIRTALAELNNLLWLHDSELCTQETAERLRDFYLHRLDTSKDRAKEGAHDATGRAVVCKDGACFRKPKPLPSSLRKFALALGMRLSATCSGRMFEALVADGGHSSALSDLKHLGKIAEANGVISRLVDDLTKPGEIILPTDITALINSTEEITPETIHVQTNYSGSVRDIKTVCERRFQPYYEPLILPLTTMASVGFNLMDKRLKKELQNVTLANRMRQWTRVVFLCETMRLVEPVDWLDETLPVEEAEYMRKVKKPGRYVNELLQSKGGQPSSEMEADYPVINERTKMVRILTKEEAEQVRARLVELGKDPESRGKFTMTMKRVKFEANMLIAASEWKLPDLLYDKSDWRLWYAIKRVRTRQTALGRVKAKMMRKALLTLGQYLWQGRFKMVASAPMKAMWRKLARNNKPDERFQNHPNAMMLTHMEQMAKTAFKAELKMEPHELVEGVLGLILMLAIAGLAIWAMVALGIFILGGSSGGR